MFHASINLSTSKPKLAGIVITYRFNKSVIVTQVEQLKFILRDLLAAGSETTMTSLRWIPVVLANQLQQRHVREQIRTRI